MRNHRCSVARGAPTSHGKACAVSLLSVSRQHAEIVQTAAGVTIRDLGSRNGIVVQGERVSDYALDDGEHVTLGDVEIWLEAR